MKKNSNWLFFLLGALLLIVLVVCFTKSSKESFYLEELKDYMVPLSGSNLLINLDQTFGFYAGLNSTTKNPLLTSGCILLQYNDKDKLILAANFLYQYHTSNIDKKTMLKKFEAIGISYSDFMKVFQFCQVECNKSDINIYRITNEDFLLGFLVGVVISQKDDKIFPCYSLINGMRQFMYDTPIESLLLYVNTVMQANGGEITQEEANEILKRNKLSRDKFKDMFKFYCKEFCEKKEVCNKL
jgi:hypothetical protein